MGKPVFLSVVVPLYNEERCAEIFYRSLREVLAAASPAHEIIFVDDGSTDGTEEVLRSLAAEDRGIRIISLARNFGHQIALTAGLDEAKGDAVVTMDGDLQHPPELIARMLEEWQNGAKIVYGVRRETKAIHPVKKTFSRLYYRLINLLSETPVKIAATDFRLMDRKVVGVLTNMRERHRLLRGMLGWMGRFPEAEIEFTAQPRAAGQSKYTYGKMLRLGRDGLLSLSLKPLYLSLWLGLLGLAFVLPYGSYALGVYAWRHGAVASGRAFLLSAVVFLGSLQLIALGVLGLYVGQIYEENKRRPLYVVRDKFPSA